MESVGCERREIVRGDEGPVSGVAPGCLVTESKSSGVHREEGQEEEGEE